MVPDMDDPNEITIASFLRSRESMNRSERTIQSYEESLLQLEEWLDGNDLLDAEKSDIEDWMAHLLREHAATTAGVRFRSVRAFYNWAVDEELITKSPMVKMKEPKPDDLPVPIVPDDHLQALIRHCEASGKHDFEGVRDVALIRMFCEPGSPRVAEMAGALLDGVSVGRRAGYEVMGKGRKARWLPLGTRAATALGRYLILRAKRPGAHLPQLWLSAKRKKEPLPLSPSGIQQMLERRAKAAGLPHIRAHQLRHTSAHWWKKSGGSEEDAEYLFGWTEGSRMVKRYAKSAGEERAQEAAKRMSIGDRL